MKSVHQAPTKRVLTGCPIRLSRPIDEHQRCADPDCNHRYAEHKPYWGCQHEPFYKCVDFLVKIILAVAILVLFSSMALSESSVSLAWDASISTNIAGYKIYYGQTSHAYGTPDITPNQTSWTVKNLGPGTWYFAATAFDTSGNESDFSNEVSTTITAGVSPVTLQISVVPTPGPRVTLLLVPSILTTQATIVWQTDVECDGFALWSTDGTNWKSVTSNHLGTTEHLAVIGPLLTRTHYQYKVTGTCGTVAIESKVGSFNTK